ncbi:4-alpha-glucanotransferase [Ahrensia sp. R2A130]|uniref:4-alpha-glucanotransferase n=1 Tax=Ahrensia sp. R2A130 TaxID=744979 RepID=UPI0001E0BCE8|nr:4-alpha-glucanotransferase [Ahrensia sp. R2A130]EFL87583.1 4-alpha-glucanotransferase [Ahrensia sp. R2A130]
MADDKHNLELEQLVTACEAHGIEPVWEGIDKSLNPVPPATLEALATTFSISDAPPAKIDGIAQALKQSKPARCFVPAQLQDARVWGVSCQLGALRSDRNAGMGDFADLAALCKIIGEAGGDFIGLNPLHALFWADPDSVSPFSPSNRTALNPIYIALDWIQSVVISNDFRTRMEAAREGDFVDVGAVAQLKDEALRQAFAVIGFDCEHADHPHALFEALSCRMVAAGYGAGWTSWPPEYQDRKSEAVSVLTQEPDFQREIAYHVWLQQLADEQLARVNRAARAVGLRIGLYLDLAVGVAPDGSATWMEPDLSVPGVKIGAPPDPFSATGQDWGLAPLSPVALAQDATPFADMMRTVMRHAGAVRVDHAMALARLFLIPANASALDGAYVRYPFSPLLNVLAKVSEEQNCIVIGEDLGVVPDGFRDVMKARALHAYKVFWFERNATDFDDPSTWDRDALACVGTHDTATFAGWWTGADLEARAAIGQFDAAQLETELLARDQDRQALRRAIGDYKATSLSREETARISLAVHSSVAASPCRLAVMQLDDVLGATIQPNMPGTTSEHPNWRVKLTVALETLSNDPAFSAHTKIMHQTRPKLI